MNGSQKEAGNLLQKEGVPKKEGKKVPSDKGGGVPTLEETMPTCFIKLLNRVESYLTNL